MVDSTTKHREGVKGAPSVGKTRGLSRPVLWWVSVHSIGDAGDHLGNDDNIKGAK
jgi:hypothetical protein